MNEGEGSESRRREVDESYMVQRVGSQAAQALIWGAWGGVNELAVV